MFFEPRPRRRGFTALLDYMEHKSFHSYFRIGDVVVNESIWGNRLFIICAYGGSAYCPELHVRQRGKPLTNAYFCNWDVRTTKLVNAGARPLIKFDHSRLTRLMKIGSDKIKEEAKREIIIRNNCKIYEF